MTRRLFSNKQLTFHPWMKTMMINSRLGAFNAALLISLNLLAGSAQAGDVDTTALKGLDWRLVGPYIGGRVTTVAGVADNSMLYYMGATGGGVWKTENAGTTWENLSDDFFKVGTIDVINEWARRENVPHVASPGQ